LTIPNLNAEESAAVQNEHKDFVRRPEHNQLIESLNREFSGLATTQANIDKKLDLILNGRVEEARQMGALQENVRRLEVDVAAQTATIRKIESDATRNQLAPRDAAIKYLFELLKLGVAALVGYLFSGGRPHL
jgi:hypothetical protein